MFNLPSPDQLRVVFQDWLESWIPRKSQKHYYNFRTETYYIANQMDPQRLRDLLAAAEAGNTKDLFALYRDIIAVDSHLQSELGKRKMAMLGDPYTVQPFDEHSPQDQWAAKVLNDQVASIPNFIRVVAHLMDSVLFPVAVVEKVYAASAKPGVRFDLKELVMVPAQDLDYSTAFLQLWELDPESGYITGTRQPPDPARYIVHRNHLLQQADFWGGPMRCLLFWWLLRNMSRDWWGRFLERYGAPFLVGKYDQADDAARQTLSNAFNQATKLFGLVISKDTEVQLVQAMSQGAGEAFDKLMGRCDDEISKVIVGQVGSSKISSTGLGSGQSKQHESVRQDLRQMDAIMLSETLEDQLFAPWLHINGLPGRVRLVWGGASQEEQAALGTLLQSLSTAGLEPTDDGLTLVSDKVAIPLQRKAAAPAPAPTGMSAFSASLVDQGHESVDKLAANAAPGLSQAFRGSLAPIRRIVRESNSAEECQSRIQEFYADWKPAKVAGMVEEALVAYAANGAVSRSPVKK